MNTVSILCDTLMVSGKYRYVKIISDNVIYVNSGKVTGDLLNAEATVKVYEDGTVSVEDNREILEHANFMGLDKRDQVIHQIIETCFDNGEFTNNNVKIPCDDNASICVCVDDFFKRKCLAIEKMISYAKKNKIGKYGK